MKFPLLGREIEISEGRKNYMNVYAHFHKMANDAVDAYRKDYDTTFGLTIFSSSFLEKYSAKYNDKYFANFIRKYVTETKRFLTTYGVYTVSDGMIEAAVTEEHGGISRLQYRFNTFEDDLLFGNDGITDGEAASRIKSKFECGYFDVSLRNDIMTMCDYVLNYLRENNAAEIEPIYKADVQKAEAYYENLKDQSLTTEQMSAIMMSMPHGLSDEEFEIEYAKRRPASIPREEQEKMAFELITLDPRKEIYYQYIFTQMPKARFEIGDIARYLSVDLSDFITKSIPKLFPVKGLKTEEAALKMQEELQAYMDHFRIGSCSVKNELDKILHDFDVKARTYDGILYETRALCAQAGTDDEALSVLYGDGSGLSKEACREYIANIQNGDYVAQIKEKYTKRLDTRIIQIDRETLEAMLLGLDHKTEGECNEVKNLIGEYDAAEATKKPFLDRIEKRIYNIWDAEDFERFAELYKQTPVGNYAVIAETCNIIKSTGRTTCKELFLNALPILNNEEVANAAKYIIAKEKGTLSSLFNMGKKGNYEILTIHGKVIHPAIQEAVKIQKETKPTGLFGRFKNSLGF